MKPYRCVSEGAILKWIPLQPITSKSLSWYQGDMEQSTHPSSLEVWTPKIVSKIKQFYMLRCTTFWIVMCRVQTRIKLSLACAASSFQGAQCSGSFTFKNLGKADLKPLEATEVQSLYANLGCV